MAFTLSTFVWFAAAEALSEHLRSRDVTLAEQIDAEADTAALSKLFRKAWSSLPQAAIEQLNQDFDRAEQFVGEDAQSVLRNSCLRNAAALAVLERWSNDRARALAILRSEPAIFEDAENQLDVLALLRNRQLCAGFRVESTAAPEWSDARLSLFEDRAGDVFRNKNGVPRCLQIKHDVKHRHEPDGAPIQPIQQVTIIHEGDVNREPIFGADGELSMEERRPALMAAERIVEQLELSGYDVRERQEKPRRHGTP